VSNSVTMSTSRLRVVIVALLATSVLGTVGLISWRLHGGSSAAATSTSAPTGRGPIARAAARESVEGLPLRGMALEDSGLRLLVADSPAPFILDVDHGTTKPVTGLPTHGERDVTVAPLRDGALIISARYCGRCHAASVYVLHHGTTTAMPLGRALEIVPSGDGHGVWVLRKERDRCSLADVGLDGRPRRTPIRVSCRTAPVKELPAGLLTTFTGPYGMNAHNTLLPPGGGSLSYADSNSQPVVGNLVLTGADAKMPLLLHDMATGANRRLRWPAGRTYGLGEVTGQPSGSLATVDFARYTPVDRFDLWLLDTSRGRWEELPGMPARIVPKTTHVEWTADGRVVLLATNLLAVWRPGERELSVARVRRPKQPGIDFVVW
jgi:hypothetical protein